MEELLCGTWMDQKRIIWKTKSYDPELENWKFRIFSLRDRMLSFVQQFAYYVTIEVLEPNWRLLESNLGKVSTVDQVLQCHSDFLDTCLKECMLTSAKLLRVKNTRLFPFFLSLKRIIDIQQINALLSFFCRSC
jgi:gamma-tubulin complex component 2